MYIFDDVWDVFEPSLERTCRWPNCPACAGAADGRNHNATACDRAFTTVCGAVADTLAPCEECVIDHAAYFIVGWGCGGEGLQNCAAGRCPSGAPGQTGSDCCG